MYAALAFHIGHTQLPNFTHPCAREQRDQWQPVCSFARACFGPLTRSKNGSCEDSPQIVSIERHTRLLFDFQLWKPHTSRGIQRKLIVVGGELKNSRERA